MGLFASLLAACSDPATIVLTDYGTALWSAQCDWAVRCRHVPDLATCDRLTDPRRFDTRRAQDAILAGRLDYDPVQAARCVESMRIATCLAAPFSDRACTRALIGVIGEGGACTSDFECAHGADCEQLACDAQCCSGICGPPVPPPAEPKLADIGEPCMTHSDCVVEAYCETDRRCTSLPDQPGQRCLFGCALGDLFCDTDTLTCRQFAARGASCSDQTPCDPAWAVCDGGVCIDRPGGGQACDDAQRLCIPTTFCDQAICRPLGNAGSPCADRSQCILGCELSTGTCAGYVTCEP